MTTQIKAKMILFTIEFQLKVVFSIDSTRDIEPVSFKGFIRKESHIAI